MCVDNHSLAVAVPQLLLDRADVLAAFEKVAGE